MDSLRAAPVLTQQLLAIRRIMCLIRARVAQASVLRTLTCALPHTRSLLAHKPAVVMKYMSKALAVCSVILHALNALLR
jgi:hypothetical protein